MDFKIKKLDVISIIKNLIDNKNIDKANLLINKIQNLSEEEFKSALEENDIKSTSDVMNFISNYLGITSLKITSLNDLNIDDTFFHFTNSEHIKGIETNGLNSKIGERSSGLEKDKMYFFSKGRSVLQTTDVWIKWIMQRAFGEKNAFGIYDNLDERTVNGMQQHWYRIFLDESYLHADKRKEVIFPLIYKGMQERRYLALDLEEGEDFSYDAIDVKKERALENRENGNDTDYRFMKTMYGRYSQVNSPIVDNWNLSSFPMLVTITYFLQ